MSFQEATESPADPCDGCGTSRADCEDTPEVSGAWTKRCCAACGQSGPVVMHGKVE